MENVQKPDAKQTLAVALLILCNLIVFTMMGGNDSAISMQNSASNTSDTKILKKFDTGKTSVSSIKQNRQKTLYHLFDRNGKKSYEIEEINGSYRVQNQFIYRNDGSVRLVKQTVAPGGSRYTYHTDIKFDINNNPTWMTTRRQPGDLQQEVFPMNFYWDKSKKKWIKQESSGHCAPAPSLRKN